MTITGFSFPTAIRFGAGARKQVAAHLLEQGLKRPLIVTDPGVKAAGVLHELHHDDVEEDVLVREDVAEARDLGAELAVLRRELLLLEAGELGEAHLEDRLGLALR